LWYLNFVQTPTVPKIEPAEHRAAVTSSIAPNVLFWFRYSALATGDLRSDPWPGRRPAGMTSRVNTMFLDPDALLHGGAAKCGL